MARTVVAEKTITDITDGTSPILGYITNENHTFSATEAGVVNAVTNFSTQLIVYSGSTKLAYDTDNSDSNSEYRITSAAYVGTSTGWGTPAIAHTGANAGTVTIPSIANNPTLDVVLRITFRVKDSGGVAQTGLTRDCTLSVVQHGAGGNVISVVAAGQTYTSNSAGVLDSGLPNIDMVISTQGTPGNLSFAVAQGTGSYVTKSGPAAGAGNIVAYSTSLTNAFISSGTFPATGVVRLRVNSNNLGNSNNSITIRVSGAMGGSDYVTIYKVRTGATGANALIAVIESNNGDVFKNSAGTAKTLSSKVYESSDGTEVTSGLSYVWKYADGTDVRVTSAATRTVVSSGGVVASGTGFPTIIVGPEDVTTTANFRCTTTVT